MSSNNDEWKNLTFAQRVGAEPLPTQLKPTELSDGLRSGLWAIVYHYIATSLGGEVYLTGKWNDILYRKHVYFDKGMANEFVDHWMTAAGRLSGLFKQGSYTQVYGCLEFFLRDSDCPLDFSESLNDVLKSNLAPYTIIDGNTITPIASHEQGLLLAHALDQLSKSPMVGASQHLKQAIEFLNKGQWAKSITESIRAVESVARKIEPSANTLDPALKNLAPKIGMHSAM